MAFKFALIAYTMLIKKQKKTITISITKTYTLHKHLFSLVTKKAISGILHE